jgi:putative transcriptional regulator
MNENKTSNQSKHRRADQEERRDIVQELVDAIEDIRAYKRGEIALRTWRVEPSPSPAEIRIRMGLSQHAFADMLGVSVRTVQDWEQGRRMPRGPARQLLRVAEQHPEALLDLR